MFVDAPMIRALIIEDAPDMRLLAKRLLEENGFDVTEAPDGEQGLAIAETQQPDLILLDLNLPGMDGLDVCRRLRAISDAYIVIVTGREDELDKVEGFTVGADDYVTKPYSPAELRARIQAMLRRPRTPVASTLQTRSIGDIGIDVDARVVTVAGEPVELTRTEFDILSALSERPGGVLSREALLRRIWGPNWFGDAHVVDVHVSNLRRKLGAAGKQVQTARGVGFRLVEQSGSTS
jgi:DNA-binding response OmpR family regulator